MKWIKTSKKYSAKLIISSGNIYYISWNDVGLYCLYHNKTYITSGTKKECDMAVKKRLKVSVDVS